MQPCLQRLLAGMLGGLLSPERAYADTPSQAGEAGKRLAAGGYHSLALKSDGTVAACGILSGYDENTFGPDDPVTREQMAVMAAKAARLAPANEQLTFKDRTDISSWAREAVATVVRGGIMKGNPDGTFRPKSNATRAEAVTVIINALK